jgi:hypothetical protein
MVDNKETKMRYSFVIRHGERVDKSKAFKHLYKNNWDAHLTSTGHIHAEETA